MYSLISNRIDSLVIFSSKKIEDIKKYSTTFIKQLWALEDFDIEEDYKNIFNKINIDEEYKDCKLSSLRNSSIVILNLILEQYDLKIVINEVDTR